MIFPRYHKLSQCWFVRFLSNYFLVLCFRSHAEGENCRKTYWAEMRQSLRPKTIHCYAQPAKLLVQMAARKRWKVCYQPINSPINGLRQWGKSGAKGLKRNNWLFESFLQCCHAVAHQRPMKFIELFVNLWAIMNRMHFDLISCPEAYRKQPRYVNDVAIFSFCDLSFQKNYLAKEALFEQKNLIGERAAGMRYCNWTSTANLKLSPYCIGSG